MKKYLLLIALCLMNNQAHTAGNNMAKNILIAGTTAKAGVMFAKYTQDSQEGKTPVDQDIYYKNQKKEGLKLFKKCLDLSIVASISDLFLDTINKNANVNTSLNGRLVKRILLPTRIAFNLGAAATAGWYGYYWLEAKKHGAQINNKN